jgi:hypothetical protein
MRYVTIPSPITPVDPLTGGPIAGMESCTFARSCRTALALAAQRGNEDMLAIIDLRHKTDEALEGAVLALNDSEWKILESEFKRPNAQAFGVAWMFSAESHQRAVIDAPTKAPVKASTRAA